MVPGPVLKLRDSIPRNFEVLGLNKVNREIYNLPKYSVNFKKKLELSKKVKELDVYNKNGDMFPLTKRRNENPIWIIRELYRLIPIEIIRYICLLCIFSNKGKWKKNHKRLSMLSFGILNGDVKFLDENDKIDLGDERWYISIFQSGDYLNVPCLNNRKICDKYFKKFYEEDVELDDIDDLESVNLTPSALIDFNINKTRELVYLKSGKKHNTRRYLFSPKCRCFDCDIIRCAAIIHKRYYKGFKKDKKKYSNLYHDYDDDMWSSYPKEVYGFAE